MAVIIAHAVKNELKKWTGGKKGDQTGTEICRANWYYHNKGWGAVIRAKNPEVAERVARAMEMIVDNPHFGYGQTYRLSGFNEAEKCGFDPSKVVVDCELDCSQSIRVSVHYAGVKCKNFRTKNEAATLKSTDEFEILTDDKYCKSSKYLKRGDILCTPAGVSGHTVVVLTDGSEVVKVKEAVTKKESSKEKETTKVKYNEAKVKVAKYFNKSLAGTYKTTCGLKLRYGAGTSNDKILVMPKGAKVRCYGYYNKVLKTKWYLVEYGDYVGYCSSKYLKK